VEIGDSSGTALDLFLLDSSDTSYIFAGGYSYNSLASNNLSVFTKILSDGTVSKLFLRFHDPTVYTGKYDKGSIYLDGAYLYFTATSFGTLT
jgi:hypothetical protein